MNKFDVNHFTKTISERLEGVNISRLSRELEIPATLLFEWKQAKRLPSFKNLIYVKKLTTHWNIEFESIIFETCVVKCELVSCERLNKD